MLNSGYPAAVQGYHQASFRSRSASCSAVDAVSGVIKDPASAWRVSSDLR